MGKGKVERGGELALTWEERKRRGSGRVARGYETRSRGVAGDGGDEVVDRQKGAATRPSSPPGRPPFF